MGKRTNGIVRAGLVLGILISISSAAWATAPSVSISDVARADGGLRITPFNFTASLSAASEQTITVTFSTADGTAIAGSDYVAASGTVTFAPGETTKTITVLVNGDMVVEDSETFFVNLTSATNATVADGQGAGTILNHYNSCMPMGMMPHGDFNGDCVTDIGVYRNGGWYMDMHGMHEWEGCDVDGCYEFGLAGDYPVVGDWMGSGQAMMGVYRNGGWYMDLNSNHEWDGCEVDGCYEFGLAGDYPVVGDWMGNGQAMIGVYRDGGWYLDLNGNRKWDGCEVDGCYVFGMAGDIPVN